MAPPMRGDQCWSSRCSEGASGSAPPASAQASRSACTTTMAPNPCCNAASWATNTCSLPLARARPAAITAVCCVWSQIRCGRRPNTPLSVRITGCISATATRWRSPSTPTTATARSRLSIAAACRRYSALLASFSRFAASAGSRAMMPAMSRPDASGSFRAPSNCGNICGRRGRRCGSSAKRASAALATPMMGRPSWGASVGTLSTPASLSRVPAHSFGTSVRSPLSGSRPSSHAFAGEAEDGAVDRTCLHQPVIFFSSGTAAAILLRFDAVLSAGRCRT